MSKKDASDARGQGRAPRSARERLQKILSAAGVASRRLSESLIQQGRVSVNGTVVTELGTKADPARDDVRVDGRRVRVESRRRYILLNKPRGYVTTRSDPQGRRTVMDLLTGVREYVYPVGRLDYDSEGLLLLTNDGELAARLMHPSHDVERVYEARVRGVPDARAVERLARGITLDGRRTAPARVGTARTADVRDGRVTGDDRDRPARGAEASGASDVRGGRTSGRPASPHPDRSNRRRVAHDRSLPGPDRTRVGHAASRGWRRRSQVTATAVRG